MSLTPNLPNIKIKFLGNDGTVTLPFWRWMQQMAGQVQTIANTSISNAVVQSLEAGITAATDLATEAKTQASQVAGDVANVSALAQQALIGEATIYGNDGFETSGPTIFELLSLGNDGTPAPSVQSIEASDTTVHNNFFYSFEEVNHITNVSFNFGDEITPVADPAASVVWGLTDGGSLIP